MDRPSRRGANKAAKAEAAGLALKNLREKGLKRMDTVEDLEDNDVYTSVRTQNTRLSLSGRSMHTHTCTFALNHHPHRSCSRNAREDQTHPWLRKSFLAPPKTKTSARPAKTTTDLPRSPRPLSPPQMTEEEYAKFANERRKKYGGFVVGEEGDECVRDPDPTSRWVSNLNRS